MSAFKPSVKVLQSDDNQTLTYLEDSNYADNDENIIKDDVINRVMKVYDSNGILLYTRTLVLNDSGDYYTTIPITKDVYLATQLTDTIAGPIDYVGTNSWISTGFYNKAFVSAMKQNGCGCQKQSTCSDITWSQNQKNAAIILASRGFGDLSQKNIDAANAIVTPTSNC